MDQICCDKCGRGIDGEQYCGDCMADEIASWRKAEAAAARMAASREAVEVTGRELVRIERIGRERAEAEVARLTAERNELQIRVRVAEATKKLAYAEIDLVEKQRDELRARVAELEAVVERLTAEKENKYRPFTVAQIDVLRLMGVHVKPRVNTDGTPSQAVFNNRANEAEKQLKELRERIRAALAQEEK